MVPKYKKKNSNKLLKTYLQIKQIPSHPTPRSIHSLSRLYSLTASLLLLLQINTKPTALRHCLHVTATSSHRHRSTPTGSTHHCLSAPFFPSLGNIFRSTF